jgi:hypothetical protein
MHSTYFSIIGLQRPDSNIDLFFYYFDWGQQTEGGKNNLWRSGLLTDGQNAQTIHCILCVFGKEGADPAIIDVVVPFRM